MSQAIPPQVPIAPAVSGGVSPAVPRFLVIGALVGLLVFIGIQARSLWKEYRHFQVEWQRSKSTVIVGYPGITPKYSSAERPNEWVRQDGGATLLWGGWLREGGHQWFRTASGDVPLDRISGPMGRDVLQAIDYPISESRSGPHWDIVPDDTILFSHDINGVANAYPLLVLDKVGVVNDRVGEDARLIVYNHVAGDENRINAFEPRVSGQRLTLGTAGYFHDHAPMLYDRGTESLWVHSDEGLVSIAGAHKGQKMKKLAPPVVTSFGRWRSENPSGRLVVGADRTQAPPKL